MVTQVSLPAAARGKGPVSHGLWVRFSERFLARACGLEWDGVRRVWYARTESALQRWLRASREPRVRAWYLGEPQLEPCAIPLPDGRALMPFQAEGVRFALERFRVLDLIDQNARGGVLVADEMGLGKTVQAIAVINALAPRRVLIVPPASLRLNWRRELLRWLCGDGWTVHVAEARALPTEMNRDRAVVIAHYEALVRHVDALCEWKPELVVLDEAHYVKRPGAKRSSAARKVVAVARRVLALTGTPIVNRPAELWGIVRLVAPDVFRSRYGYIMRYCGGDFDGRSNVGTNLPELQQLLRRVCMVRRTKREVLPQLPAIQRQVVPIAATGSLQPLLAEEKAAIASLREARGDKELWNRSWGRLATVRRKLGLAKVPAVVEHVLALLEETEKVVVWTHHHEVQDAICAVFGKQAVLHRGGIPEQERDHAVTRFQNDPDCRVFVGSILAAGVGLTLTAASVCVFAELDWVPGNLSQAEARLHRIGQTEPVLVQHLVVDGSIDERLVEKIMEKQRLIDAAIGGAELPLDSSWWLAELDCLFMQRGHGE